MSSLFEMQRENLKKMRDLNAQKEAEKDLKKLFPESSWNKLHLQIIYYGREYCTARSCFGLECEICYSCFPRRKKAIKTLKA